MIFRKKHDNQLYYKLLSLSRNIFFYKKLNLPDTFETRIYLMFFHFSIILIIFKKKNVNFDQNSYDNLFHSIENNLRELGLGDVSVNKKMKELNKILYDILLKIEINETSKFEINQKLIFKYFEDLNQKIDKKHTEFELYFKDFYNFCFELPIDNMIRELNNFNYGSS